MDVIEIAGIILILGILYCAYHKATKNVVYPNDPMIERIRNDLYTIDPQSSKFQYISSNESYTEDKQKIFLCLRDENGEYYDYNMLIYVSIHELAHGLAESVDTKHVTLEFNNLFHNLLNIAREKGIYDPSKPLVTQYCPLKK